MPIVTAGLVQAILTAHTTKRTSLGQYPPPTSETILAAEILKHTLGRTYAGKFAVSVTELGSDVSDKVLFIIAVSGYHPNLSFDRLAAATTLNRELGDHLSPLTNKAGYVFTQPLDATYHPMHKTTQDFFQKAFGTSYQNVTFAQARQAFADFRKQTKLDAMLSGVNRPKATFGGSSESGALLSKLKGTLTPDNVKSSLDAAKQRTPAAPAPAPTFAATFVGTNLSKTMIVTIAATALAIRMDLFGPADLPEAIRTVRTLANDLKFVASKVTGPSAELTAYGLFGQFLLDVLKPHLVTAAEDERPSLIAVEISSTDTAAKMVRAVSKETVDAWGANALGRFCAEPKGYFYSRNAQVWATRTPVYVSGKPMPLGSIAETNQFGVLRGQLAFWYNTTTGADFNKTLFVHDGSTMPGAGAAPCNGAYMLPCSSCAERSGLMTLGLRHSTGAAVPGVFPWMKATEKEIYDYLQKRFTTKLDHTATTVLVHTVMEHRTNVGTKGAKPDFEEVIRDRARRMAIIL
jgi:hypothetical protein